MSTEEESGGFESLVGAEQRPVVYCIVPAELAERLHDPLRRHFAKDSSVEVVVERRRRQRRSGADRREGAAGPPSVGERRQPQAAEDRRLGERRAAQVPAKAVPELPRRARRYAERLSFVRRLEPPTQQAEDLDTARLVARHQAGDSAAFDTLYTRYFDRVYGYLKIVLKDHHEAEDATQQVFANVFEALPGYERRSRPFRNWLFTVARNYAIQHLRKQGRLQVTDPAELDRQREELGEVAPEAEVELSALDWIVDRDLLFLVERLPVPQRQVLVYRYMLGLTTKETARVLGIKPNHVAVLHYRALNYLRERLTALGRAPARDTDREPMRTWPKPAKVLRNRRFVLK